MIINVIDYRGDDTVINTRGETLYEYRTRYFHRIQEDFDIWKSAGHQFFCFTQHKDNDADFWGFDNVVEMPRGKAAEARNYILDYHKPNDWISIWDNDASVYFDKLDTTAFIKNLDSIALEADKLGLSGFIPFNAQQAPYPANPKRWKPWIALKGTMLFLKVLEHRYDTDMDCLEDLEYPARLTLQGHKFAKTEMCSLKEYVNGKSTIFRVNAYHETYLEKGNDALGKYEYKWDATLDRNNKYAIAKEYIQQKLGFTLTEITKLQKKLWQDDLPTQWFIEQ